jgi:hypothetical protein
MSDENRQALFFNFTNKPFTGYWDGKPRTFKPGQKQYMEEWRARHYAKHLTNQVLLEQGKENATSPKFPLQVPEFMEIFNKACIIEEDQPEEQDESDLINKQHEATMNIPVNKPTTKKPEVKAGKGAKVPTLVDGKEPQIITGPDEDEDEDEDFEGLDDK